MLCLRVGWGGIETQRWGGEKPAGTERIHGLIDQRSQKLRISFEVGPNPKRAFKHFESYFTLKKYIYMN